MNKVKITTALTVALITTGFASPTLASASAVDKYSSGVQTNVHQTENFNQGIDSSTQYLDQFVIISNGRYAISENAKLNLSQNQFAELTNQLSMVNQQLAENGWGIDEKTKSIFKPQVRISGMKSTEFWWGTRYYFYTNQAVHDFSWKLKSIATVMGITGVVTGFVDPLLPIFSTVRAGAISWDADQLEHYNNNHIHSHIFMDLNATTAGVSFGTF
ncbi:hypothetical protein [Companilactobacillus furfuricola]|uniref:hypothetical protein n=1 Tax=Companilactobacillus furfuricola TaxID=1462575 RepID=UPI000F767DEC|nr:hypothetical protein [Companilactobacillus furfuricola]